GLVALDVADAQPEEGKQVWPTLMVENREGIELVDARSERSVFHVVQPAAGNDIFVVLFFLSQPPAHRVYIPKRETEAHSQLLQSSARFLRWPGPVHFNYRYQRIFYCRPMDL